MKNLRLLVSEKCNRACQGCCNKDIDLDGLQICTNFKDYDLIMVTGGEPMIIKKEVIHVIEIIRQDNPRAKIIMYTAYRDSPVELLHMLDILDGITITLHEQEDVEPFLKLVELIKSTGRLQRGFDKLLRVNIFEGVAMGQNPEVWTVKRNIKWIKNCPLPENEDFKRFCNEDELYLL